MLDNRKLASLLITKQIPVRAVICILMFTACWTSYNCRLQMPILVVQMMNGTRGANDHGTCSMHDNDNVDLLPKSRALISTIDELMYKETHEDKKHQLNKRNINETSTIHRRQLFDLFSGEKYSWSPTIRGSLLAAYGLGNIPGNLCGGIIAMKIGPRHTILWTSLVAAIISLISPLLANFHWMLLFGSRVIIGLTGGVIFPACHALVAKWAPPDEKARFVWSLQGGTFGTIFTLPLVAYIAEKISWEMGWYIPTIFMFVWLFFWFLLAYDSPAEHPGISSEEKSYILRAQAGSVRAEKPALRDTPIKSILTSIPFLSLVICHFGNVFLIFFYQNSIMIYLKDVLGFKLSKGGFLASLPWSARLTFGFLFSWVGDIIKRKQILSVTALRKVATIFSHFIPGMFLITVGYVGCSFELAITFLVLALGFNGAANVSNLANNQDLSPNYAGFLYGLMNTVGSATGIIIPALQEAIAGRHGDTVDRWQIVFWIGGGVCIFSMIIFLIGGSGKIQSWNDPKSRV